MGPPALVMRKVAERSLLQSTLKPRYGSLTGVAVSVAVGGIGVMVAVFTGVLVGGGGVLVGRSPKLNSTCEISLQVLPLPTRSTPALLVPIPETE